jgi:hypothetical protein
MIRTSERGEVAAQPAVAPRGETGVLLAYADAETGVEAIRIFNHLFGEPGAGERFQLGLWRFDSFNVSLIQQAAVQQAAGAHAIIIAPRGHGRVPDAVCSWLDAWSGSRTECRGTLIAVLEPEEDPASGECAVWTQLRSAAEKAGMDFICERLAPPGHTAGHPPARPGSDPVHVTVIAHWGAGN